MFLLLKFWVVYTASWFSTLNSWCKEYIFITDLKRIQGHQTPGGHRYEHTSPCWGVQRKRNAMCKMNVETPILDTALLKLLALYLGKNTYVCFFFIFLTEKEPVITVTIIDYILFFWIWYKVLLLVKIHKTSSRLQKDFMKFSKRAEK